MGHTNDSDEINVMYQEFEDASKAISYLPLYIAPGNHEETDESKLKPIFLKYFKNTYQAFPYQDSYFIILNSNEPGEKYQIASVQFKWLKKQLKKIRASKEPEYNHIFVFLHHPLYPKVHHIGSSLDKFPEQRDKLAKLLKEYNVESVFTGHVHIFNESIVNGLHQYIIGGGGAPLYGKGYKDGSFNHFMLVTVDGDDTNYAVFPVENDLEDAISDYFEGNNDGAQLHLADAVKFMPRHPEVLFTRYLLVKNEKLLKEDIFKIISKTLGSDFEAYMGLGHFLNDHKLSDDALELFKKAIEANPTDQEPYFRVAQIYERNGDSVNAIFYYKKALKYTKKGNYILYIMKKLKKLQGGKLK